MWYQLQQQQHRAQVKLGQLWQLHVGRSLWSNVTRRSLMEFLIT